MATTDLRVAMPAHHLSAIETELQRAPWYESGGIGSELVEFPCRSQVYVWVEIIILMHIIPSYCGCMSQAIPGSFDNGIFFCLR